jgi:hypothetical protein
VSRSNRHQNQTHRKYRSSSDLVQNLKITKIFNTFKEVSWWLIPVILATWGAEIKRIVVLGQPRQKSLQDPILMGKKQKARNGGATCHPAKMGGKHK